MLISSIKGVHEQNKISYQLSVYQGVHITYFNFFLALRQICKFVLGFKHIHRIRPLIHRWGGVETIYIREKILKIYSSIFRNVWT